MPKYMSKDDLKTFEKTLLFSREQVVLSATLDRSSYDNAAAAQKTDGNLSDNNKITHVHWK